MTDAGPRWAPFIDFLLPTGCVACRSWIPRSSEPAGSDGAIVCDRCRSRLTPPTWPRCPRCHAPRGTGRDAADDCLECRAWPGELRSARSAFVLEPPATDLVHALKYEGWRELAEPMGKAMAEAALEHAPAAFRQAARVRVVAVPTTPRRVRSRGYNQARLLARAVSRELDLPTLDGLERRPAPRSQTTLSPAERRENVRGAFRPAAGAAGRVAGCDVLLVDDVLTTGATAGEAARVLAGAGAASVVLLTYARALARSAGARTAA